MSKEEGSLGYSYQLPSRGTGLKLRSVLSQFSDIFSEFNKYIAPAYHHDRCERSVQMKVYGMHKREFVLMFLMIFAMLGLLMFIGLAGPPITITTEQKASNFLKKSNDTDISKGPFVMRSPAMNTYNQQLWVLGKITTDNVEGDNICEHLQRSTHKNRYCLFHKHQEFKTW